MINEDKVLVMDIDGTLCEIKDDHSSYLDVKPKEDIIKKLREYVEQGFYVILHSSRNMRTYKGNVGRINANTAKTLFEWLDKYQIPYDEIYLGKPWCGKRGFYVDDKAIRPSEFAKYTYDELIEIIDKEGKR